MKILETFSPIVNMMSGVLAELNDFILFFTILVTFLSIDLSIF